jgi:Zn-dependent protease/predicted transcriptional regulator
MNYSLKLGKFLGINVFVHWTFAILIAFLVYNSIKLGGNLSDTLWYIFFVLTVFLCVTLHEYGHALAARKYGINTRDINLLPIGGVARLEGMPKKPQEELVVALAGPAVNVIIALILTPLVILQGISFDIENESTFLGPENFLPFLLFVNVILVLFNLIPAFPMDGGRVLRALLSFKLPKHKATRIAANIGQVLAIVFVFVGFFHNPFLIFIGLFIFLGAQGEANAVEKESRLSGFRVNQITMTQVGMLKSTDTLAEAVKKLLDGQSTCFLVFENGAVIGTLNRSQIISGLSEFGSTHNINQVMSEGYVELNPKMLIEEAEQLMLNQGVTIAPVFDNETLLGALDLENIKEFIMIKEALEKLNE